MNQRNHIKILQICAGGNEFGGVEAFLYEHYKHFDREVFHWDFLFCGGNALATKMESSVLQKSNIYALNIIDSSCIKNLFFGRYYYLYRELKKFFYDRYYDIVHIHTGSIIIQSICATAIGNVKHPVVIAHAHGGIPSDVMIKNVVYRCLRKPVLKNSKFFFAASTPAGKRLYGASRRFMVIPNGIDVKRFCFNPSSRAVLREQLKLDGVFVLGHIARLTKIKNQIFLLKVFYELYRLYPQSRMLIVGDGEMRNVLENEAKKLGIDDFVIFAGSKTNTEDYYQAMDVFALPSFSEGLPLVTIEAQTSGLPCVVSTAVPKEADMGTKLLIRKELADGEKAWAETILSLKEYRRKDESDTVQRAGFDISATAEWLEKFYLKIAVNNTIGDDVDF